MGGLVPDNLRGKPWENYGKPWENHGKPWKIMGKKRFDGLENHEPPSKNKEKHWYFGGVPPFSHTQFLHGFTFVLFLNYLHTGL